MLAQHKYVVLNVTNNNTYRKYVVFRGKTERSATDRARAYLIDHTIRSRLEYEKEHGDVSEEEWIKELARARFTITPAKLDAE